MKCLARLNWKKGVIGQMVEPRPSLQMTASLKNGAPSFQLNRFSTVLLTRKMSTTNNAQDSPVLFEVKNNIGLITLNRPKALNALNLPMIQAMYPTLKEWENSLKFVMIQGSGGKSFCAGGDIVSITSLAKGSPQQGEFFYKEYQLNHLIGNLKIPYVALIDGITMGGGVGLSVHAPYRVATSKTLFAMPETGIGLIPDVGGSHFLPRLEGELGTYLALTGQRLKGSDCLHAGLATHACTDIEAVKNDLFEAQDQGDVEAILEKHLENFDEDSFSLEDKLPLIDECFKEDTVEAIIENLKKVDDDWSKKTVKLMGRMSPISMKVTLQMVRSGKELSLEDCLKMEYRLVRRCCQDSDFYEGVRALLVDKDNQPKWKPNNLEDVTKAIIDNYFSHLPSEEELKI